MEGSRFKTKRILLGGMGAIALGFVVVTLVITVYAFKLGFEVRGAPDREKVADFANAVAPVLSAALAFAFTLVAAWWVARKAEVARLAHGILVGAVAAAFELVISIGSSGGVRWLTLLSVALTLAGGWLGGRLAGPGKAPPSS